jgi:hypothetical protein
MTPTEIRARRLSLGLTQGQVARLIGVDARTWRRWEMSTPTLQPPGASETAPSPSSARCMPEPVHRLLRLCERPEVRGWMEEMGWSKRAGSSGKPLHKPS